MASPLEVSADPSEDHGRVLGMLRLQAVTVAQWRLTLLSTELQIAGGLSIRAVCRDGGKMEVLESGGIQWCSEAGSTFCSQNGRHRRCRWKDPTTNSVPDRYCKRNDSNASPAGAS